MHSTIRTTVNRSLIALAFMLGAATVVPVATSYATDPADTDTNTANCNDGLGVKSGLKCTKSADQKANIGPVLKTVTDVLLFILGAIAVIMIIIGGIKYTISNGDSSQVTSAKNTILYAVIGLVVALLAYAIVGFVIDSFVPGGASGTRKTT